ncbi:hypothetical protein BJX65DRAFT_118108 [Aspergillus insuetus]
MWLSLIALCLLPIGNLARRECGTLLPTISTQDDIDAIAERCESLYGGVEIDRNLAGLFVLPNVVNMSTAWLSGAGGEYDDPFGITSFEMPDLEEADWISLRSLDNLETWSTPRLAIAGDINLDIRAHLSSLEFPALEEVQGLNFYGNLSEVSLPALRTINHTLWIANTPITQYDPVIETTMNITLPLLESTSGVNFRGNMSSFMLPKLTTIKTWDDYGSSSLFKHNGTGFRWTFPTFVPSTVTLCFEAISHRPSCLIDFALASGIFAYILTLKSLSLPNYEMSLGPYRSMPTTLYPSACRFLRTPICI